MRRWLVQKAGGVLASQPRLLRVLLEGSRVEGLTFATEYGCIEIPSNAGSILDAFLAGGYYEEEVVQNFLRLAAGSHTLLNIGANIGTTARAVAGSGIYHRIRCFEPEPRNFACLVRNLASLPQVECHNAALGSIPGTRNLNLNRNSSGRHSFKTDFAMGMIPVDVTTIRDIIEEETNFDIFMDVEGWEIEVLRGSASRLNTCGVCALEWNGHLHTPADVQDAIAIMADAGFKRAVDLRHPNRVFALQDLASLRQQQIAFVRP